MTSIVTAHIRKSPPELDIALHKIKHLKGLCDTMTLLVFPSWHLLLRLLFSLLDVSLSLICIVFPFILAFLLSLPHLQTTLLLMAVWLLIQFSRVLSCWWMLITCLTLLWVLMTSIWCWWWQRNHKKWAQYSEWYGQCRVDSDRSVRVWMMNKHKEFRDWSTLTLAELFAGSQGVSSILEWAQEIVSLLSSISYWCPSSTLWASTWEHQPMWSVLNLVYSSLHAGMQCFTFNVLLKSCFGDDLLT